jgi:outer membrane protein
MGELWLLNRIENRIMKKIFYTLTLVTFFGVQAYAQTVLSLEECINIAIENNLDIKRARNNALSAKAGYTQAKMQFLPSLSAFASHNWNEGLQFDQTAGGLVNTTTLSGSGSISGNLVLFNGFQNVYGVQRDNYLYKAAQEAVKSNELQTEAAVVNGFLDIINTRENLKIQNQTNELLKEQLSREEAREKAGVGNMEQVYNFRSQIAQQELRIVNLRNQLQTAELTLIQILLLDPLDNYEFKGITPNDVLLEEEIEAYQSVYNKSRDYSPALRSAQLNLEASKKSYRITQFNWMPSLNVGANYGTSWSSNVRNPDGTVIDPRDQFPQNTFKGARFNLNVPLFTRFNNRTQMQQQKIQYLNAELTLQDTENNLRNSVQQAYLNLLNAKESYRAAKESLLNLNTAFEFSKTRYENGTIDFVTYLVSLNGKNNGELELTRAKYSILFRKLILDIFMGELELDIDTIGLN